METAIGIQQFYTKKLKTLEFEGEWAEFCGQPETNGTFFIWGNSGNGKTAFALQLCKYIQRFGKVVYNSLEEGISESLRINFRYAGIEQTDNIVLLNKEPMTRLCERLRKAKSPRFIVIDSFQYSQLNALAYKRITNEFSNKLFIIISHADGKQPAGRGAKTVLYDADVKIWIEGFKAFPISRYGGGKVYTISEKKAEELWITTNKQEQ